MNTLFCRQLLKHCSVIKAKNTLIHSTFNRRAMQSSKTNEAICLLSDGACSSRTDSSAPCTEAYPDDAVSLRLSSSLIEVTFDVLLDTVACTDSVPSSTSTFAKKRKCLSYSFEGIYIFLEKERLQGMKSCGLLLKDFK